MLLSNLIRYQCCVGVPCSTSSGSGVCQNTGTSCSGGSYIAGACPGPSTNQVIQHLLLSSVQPFFLSVLVSLSMLSVKICHIASFPRIPVDHSMDQSSKEARLQSITIATSCQLWLGPIKADEAVEHTLILPSVVSNQRLPSVPRRTAPVSAKIPPPHVVVVITSQVPVQVQPISRWLYLIPFAPMYLL